jgi:hypothetical protein
MNPPTLSLAGEMKRFGKRYAPERFYLLIEIAQNTRNFALRRNESATLSLAGRNVAFGKALRPERFISKKYTAKNHFGCLPMYANMPPSTYKIWPLTKSDAPEAKNIAGPAKSSGVPQRAAGVLEIIKLSNGCLEPSGCFSRRGAVCGVAIYPDYPVALDVKFAVFGSNVPCQHFKPALGGRVCRDRFTAELAHH